MLAISFVILIGVSAALAVGFIRHRKAERAIEAREEWFRVMFDQMLTPLFITNDHGVIQDLNQAFARLAGLPREQLLNRSVGDFLILIDGETREQARNRIAGKTTQNDMRRADGRILPVEVTLTPFEVAGQRYFAANWVDISGRREVDRMKDEFVSVVSHELRTPLTSIRGALQIVLMDKPEFKDPEQEPLLAIALNNTERLIRIINDILDISKIEAGELQLRLRPCDATELAQTSIQNVLEIAKAADVQVVADVGSAPGAVNGDFDRLVQVFVNLLSNAIKFSPAGSTVTLAARRTGDRVEWAVSDRGPGVAEADLGKLFKKFKQIDSSATRKKGGTGLGLSIVKALVEQHGGAVSVASTVGEGTTFTVVLPAAPDMVALMPAPGWVESVDKDGQRRGRTVLIVDDDHDLRVVLRKQLEASGYRVIEAADGEAAMALAVAEQPDLITMDLVMPGVGGLTAIRRLVDDPRTASIPVVVVSAMADSVSLGHPFAVIPKPVDGDRLRREIEHLIGRPSNATLLLAEDDDDLRRVLEHSLSRGGFTVLAASNGESAREIYDSTPCDAVVVDLHMPVLDGFGLIEHVRRTRAGADTPIVVVSGSASGDGERRSLQMGANVFFAKPVSTGALVAELNRLVA